MEEKVWKISAKEGRILYSFIDIFMLRNVKFYSLELLGERHHHRDVRAGTHSEKRSRNGHVHMANPTDQLYLSKENDHTVIFQKLMVEDLRQFLMSNASRLGQ